MWEVGRKVGATFSVINSAEGVIVLPSEDKGVWRCFAGERLGQGELHPGVLGYRITTQEADLHGRGETAVRKGCVRHRLILTISLETIRRMDSEAIAATAGAPERGARSQSNTDYVVRGERGDPRGRKSGADLGAANPR